MAGSPEEVRANLYYLLGRVFSSPLVMKESDPQALRTIIPSRPAALQGAALKLAEAWERALEDREALSLAYARHFLGPFEILSPPYASSYLEPDQRLMGKVSQQVAHFYIEAGLGSGQGPHEAPDHVALEWEFMYYLTYQYLKTSEERWIEQRERFRSTHLNCWMPSFLAAIKKTAAHEFYCCAATLLSATLSQDATDLEKGFET
jgi:TorA maturation chaperone TorD